MAFELVMPRFGWTMEEGRFVEWLKRDGDTVAPGDLLFTVESDKAINEVESFESGILRIPPNAPTPDSVLPVGAVLGYIVQPGERAPFEGDDRPPTADCLPSTADRRPPLTTDSKRLAADDPFGAAQDGRRPADDRRRSVPAISPRARRVARDLGVTWAALHGSGRTGRIVERDIRAAADRPAATVRASPLARRVADDLQVDLEQLAAQTSSQRIRRADVEQAARAEAASTPPAGTQAERIATIEALPGIRRLIAARMGESAHTTAPVTLTTDADATELVRLRQQIAADLADQGIPTPSYTDLLAKLVAVTLGEHPALNASLSAGGLMQHAAVHIGVAVDTERGLLVPVLRDVDRKSIQQIASESARLIAQARAGKAAADDLRGSTFTITNLGMYEIDAFTPIINLPECAILGVGRIAPRAVVIDEQSGTLGARKMMALSLTFDHRLVDGAPAARFLQRVKQFVEHPYRWLTR